MIGRRLNGQDRRATGPVQQWEINIVDCGAKTPEHLERRLAGGLDLRVTAGPEELPRDTDPQTLHAPAQITGEILRRILRRASVVGIVTGDGVEHQRGILDGARERANVIKRPGDHHDTAAPHAAVGRLESHDAAERGGEANGAAGVATQRGERGTSRDRRGAAA